MGIATYDYFLTLPAEVKLYRAQRSIFRPSQAAVLLFLIRYISIITIIAGAIGTYGPAMSHAECHNFFLVPGIARVVSTWISHYIMLVRTISIAGRRRSVAIPLWVIAFLTCFGEGFISLYRRSEFIGALGNCGSAFLYKASLGWMSFLFSCVYDLIVTGVATYFLTKGMVGMRFTDSANAILFKDGMWYFIILTVINLINLAFFAQKNAVIQGAMSIFGVGFTMIMSTRIILGLADAFPEDATILPTAEASGIQTMAGPETSTARQRKATPSDTESLEKGV